MHHLLCAVLLCALFMPNEASQRFLKAGFVIQQRVMIGYLEPREVDERAPLVVLLHGFPGTAFMWEPYMKMLHGAGYYPVAMDLRGYGYTRSTSWRPQTRDSFEYDEISMDVARLIRDLGKTEATLIGHDFGAALAVLVGLRNPSIVTGLMALSLPVGPLPSVPKAEFDAVSENLTAAGLESREQYLASPRAVHDFRYNASGWLAAVYNNAGPDVRPVGRPWVSRPELDNQQLPAFFTHEEFRRDVDLLRRQGVEAAANYYFQNYARFFGLLESFVSPKKLRVPYAFVGGEADPELPMFNSSLAQMEDLPDFRFWHLVPHAGRQVVREAPEEVQLQMLAFLRTIPK